MRIATALLLIAVGAILAYAVDVDVPGIRIEVLGAILFWVGVLGLVIAVVLEWRATRPSRPSRPSREPERRPPPRPYDPVVGPPPPRDDDPTRAVPRRRR
jgi:hypothetical protein